MKTINNPIYQYYADAFAIGAVGKDAAPYLEWMQKNNIDTELY